MQLINIGKTYPIILASVTSVVGAHNFVYDDLKASNMTQVIQDYEINSYKDNIGQNTYDGFITNYKFKKYLETWQVKTMLLSSVNQITEEPNFLKIVAMGTKAVPFIVAELDKEPSVLVWALNLIYDRKISDRDNLTVTEACRLWVKALKK